MVIPIKRRPLRLPLRPPLKQVELSYAPNTGVLSSKQVYTFGVSSPTRWVAVGEGTNSLAYSNDGIIWNGLGTSIFTSCIGVAWNGIMWVGAGFGANTLAYSYDGVTWTGVGASIFSVTGRGVTWNGTMWIAVGSGTNTIAYSYDGVNWVGLGTSIFSSYGLCAAWNGTMWVAVGQGTNTIGYSYNGISWTSIGTTIFTGAGRGVSWNGTMWIAVGDGTNAIAYSYNGVTWTGAGVNMFGSSAVGFDISWNGTMWIAIGNSGSNTMVYSYDGINWVTGIEHVFSSNALIPISYLTFQGDGNDSYNILSGAGAPSSTTPTVVGTVPYSYNIYKTGTLSHLFNNTAGGSAANYITYTIPSPLLANPSTYRSHSGFILCRIRLVMLLHHLRLAMPPITNRALISNLYRMDVLIYRYLHRINSVV